jgi:hypothetical protein
VIKDDRIEGEDEMEVRLIERIRPPRRKLLPLIHELVRKGPVKTRRRARRLLVPDEAGENPHRIQDRRSSESLLVGKSGIFPFPKKPGTEASPVEPRDLSDAKPGILPQAVFESLQNRESIGLQQRIDRLPSPHDQAQHRPGKDQASDAGRRPLCGAFHESCAASLAGLGEPLKESQRAGTLARRNHRCAAARSERRRAERGGAPE